MSSFGFNYGLILGLVAILLLVVALIVFLTRHTPKLNLDKEFYQAEWLKIINSCELNNHSSFAMAIINGDNLVDKAMLELGLSGRSMGERLKKYPQKFSNLNGLWAAHKLRNRLAHETGVKLNKDLTTQALANFKRALKDLGAI